MKMRFYPLPPDERRMLIANVVASDLALALAGLACGLVAAFIEGACGGSGGITGSGARFVEGLGLALMLDAGNNALAGVALALLFCAVMEFVNALMFGNFPSYTDEVMRTRQGVNGELVRLPIFDLVWMMPIVGLSEELAFRYGIVGLTLAALKPLMGFAGAGAVAVILSMALFTLAHRQYDGIWSTSFVALYGALLAIVYTTTGSLLCVAICHALYDFVDLLVERTHMYLEPDYFDGKTPDHALEDMAQEVLTAREAKAQKRGKENGTHKDAHPGTDARDEGSHDGVDAHDDENEGHHDE